MGPKMVKLHRGRLHRANKSRAQDESKAKAIWHRQNQ